MSSEALARPAAAAVERTAPRRRRRRRPSAWHLLLFPLALVFIFPFVQMLFASLMTAKEINAYPPALFPHHQSLQAYRTVLQESDFPTWFKNSVIVTTVAVVSQLLLPVYKMYAAFGIVGTLPSLFPPGMASAISIFLMRQFFVRLPREIEAILDGSAPRRSRLLLMRPALATIALGHRAGTTSVAR